MTEINEERIREIDIYRYKFTQPFMNELHNFSKIHQYDDRTMFKEAWTNWIVDYDEKGNPVGFDIARQNFTGQYANVPNNDWGVAENLPSNTKCKQWMVE